VRPPPIRCPWCGIGLFGAFFHGQGVCGEGTVPTSDWIQFEPLKTTQPLQAQLLDVQPAQGEDQGAPEGVSEEGEGGTE